MSRPARLLIPLFLFFCRCGGTAAGPAASDAAAADGATTDATPYDGSMLVLPDAGAHQGSDAGAGADSVAPRADVPSASDVPSADGGAGCAVADTGTAATVYCDLTTLHVLANGAAPARVLVTARLDFGAEHCGRIDSVELRHGATTLQTLQGGGAAFTSGSEATVAEGTAVDGLTALCAGDTSRFESVGVYVHGRRPGGTFTAQCALGPGEGRWPPMSTLLCHRGLASPPGLASAMVSAGSRFTFAAMHASVPHPGGPALRTADTSAHLVAATPLLGMPLTPRDTTGWSAMVSEGTDPSGVPTSTVDLTQMGDPFGPGWCPMASLMPDPMRPPSPVFFARVTGTTVAGPWSAELYIRSSCERIAMP